MVERGRRETLLRQLRLRFGPLPEVLSDHIEQAEPALLDAMVDRVLTAATLEEFQRESGM